MLARLQRTSEDSPTAAPADNELQTLRAALDEVDFGIVLLDAELRAQFINRAFCKMWRLPDSKAASKPAFVALMYHNRDTRAYAVPSDDLDDYIAQRVASVKAGDPAPLDLRLTNGEVIRFQCAVLPAGGRMLSYTNVTDITRQVDELEQLATVDRMTGTSNRRQFQMLAESEWSRFQRYNRPLSLLSVDIDRFTSINDRFGREVGDQMIVHVAKLCQEVKRTSDLIARIGGGEFALLLPETDLAQASVLAERLRQAMVKRLPLSSGSDIAVTVSIGVAEATLSMSGIGALMKVADQALYEAKSKGRNRMMCAPVTPFVVCQLAAE